MIKILLTEEQARAIWLNADGWMDAAGACKDGLSQSDMAALQNLCDQITAGLKAPSANAERMRQYRAAETPEQAAERRRKNAERMRARRAAK